MILYRIDSDGTVAEDVSAIFPDADTAMRSYGGDVLVLEAPSDVRVGWTWDGSAWHPPTAPGMAYDDVTDTLVPHDQYRRILHQRTVDDVLEAQRKLRSGDASIDWQAWLDALDEYNREVSDTQLQEGYPDHVEYPEYPTKPTA